MYNFKLRIRSFQRKKLQKRSIIKLRDVYNTANQFLKTFQVPGNLVNYSDSFFPAEHEY